MTSSRWIRLACAALAVFVLSRLWLAYEALPAQALSHFDGAGHADGSMQKGPFVAMLVLLQLLIPATLLSSRLITSAARGNVNLPHRDYYLAPERREASLAKLTGLLDWMALAVAVLLAVTAELGIRANLAQAAMPVAPTVPLALFAVFMIGWVVRVHRAFPRPPRTPDAHSASMP